MDLLVDHHGDDPKEDDRLANGKGREVEGDSKGAAAAGVVKHGARNGRQLGPVKGAGDNGLQVLVPAHQAAVDGVILADDIPEAANDSLNAYFVLRFRQFVGLLQQHGNAVHLVHKLVLGILDGRLPGTVGPFGLAQEVGLAHQQCINKLLYSHKDKQRVAKRRDVCVRTTHFEQGQAAGVVRVVAIEMARRALGDLVHGEGRAGGQGLVFQLCGRIMDSILQLAQSFGVEAQTVLHEGHVVAPAANASHA